MNRRSFLKIIPLAPAAVSNSPDVLFITPVRRKQIDFRKLRFNPSGDFIWNNCNGANSTFEIAKKMSENFDVNFHTAMKDCVNTILSFSEMELIYLK